MSKTAQDYENVQKEAFSKLIEEGNYSGDFEHAPHAQKLFFEAMQEAFSALKTEGPISVLDCGCGNGAWLEFTQARFKAADSMQFYGFDLTPGMVNLAAERSKSFAPSHHFKEGSILEDEAYQFSGAQQFDLIYTYDVVQQLPRRVQFDVCRTLLRRLTPGGVLVIFDNDHQSSFGRKMAFRKFVTQYFRIPMVPDYFCNAQYPPLQSFADKINQEANRRTQILVSDNEMKRALLVFPETN